MNTELKVSSHIIREEIDNMLGSGDVSNAYPLLKRVWESSPGPSTGNFVISRFLKMKPELALASCRIAFLRSFTIEPATSLLKAALCVKGIDLVEYVSDFNAYAQEIIDEKSKLYSFSADIIILTVQTRDILPDIWTRFTDLPNDKIDSSVKQVINDFRSWVKTLRSRTKASLILHTMELPSFPNHGVIDNGLESSQYQAISCINKELHSLSREFPNVYALDYNALVARHGRNNWHDEQKWLSMRMPIAADYLNHLVTEWLRYILPLRGKTCKALVTDLDNTLWGGVIGEDGPSEIQIGLNYPGSAYQALQRVMLDLQARGIILSICSKNNYDDVIDVINDHEGMLLRTHHFAAIRVNWQNKADNLIEIAEELNISLDAIAFMDDNPFECQLVRNQLPEVTVIELPKDPVKYAQRLREEPVFETLSLSSEDRERGHYYNKKRKRSDLKETASSLEEFYFSLQMVANIELVTPASIARISQLTQKTNQFNLTTHRYNEQQIHDMAMNKNQPVFTMRSQDRFGDNGIVGAAIISLEGDVCEIDTFLLSCRVIGQTLETALLATIIEEAIKKNMKKIRGWFLPTPRNLPAKDFYKSSGFTLVSEENGKSCWELELADNKLKSPPWVKRNIAVEEKNNG